MLAIVVDIPAINGNAPQIPQPVKPKKKISISDTQQNWRDVRPPLETVKKNTNNNDNKTTKKVQ